MHISQESLKATLHLVALGSSYVAGPGIPPYTDRVAGRSGRNYAHLLANQLGARLTDLSVSGATMANLIDTPQDVWGIKYAPQIDGVPADADVITVTGGGNDLDYIGGMFADSLRGHMTPGLKMRAAPQKTPVDAGTVANRFVKLIDMLGERAPRARIFLVEYLTVLGPHVKAGRDVAFDEQRIRHHQSVAAVLSDAYRLAGEARPNVTVIPIAEKSFNHALGSATPWVDPLTIRRMEKGKPCLHPNLIGMEAVANILYDMMQDVEITRIKSKL